MDIFYFAGYIGIGILLNGISIFPHFAVFYFRYLPIIILT